MFLLDFHRGNSDTEIYSIFTLLNARFIPFTFRFISIHVPFFNWQQEKSNKMHSNIISEHSMHTCGWIWCHGICLHRFCYTVHCKSYIIRNGYFPFSIQYAEILQHINSSFYDCFSNWTFWRAIKIQMIFSQRRRKTNSRLQLLCMKMKIQLLQELKRNENLLERDVCLGIQFS